MVMITVAKSQHGVCPGALRLPDGERIDGPLKGLRADQVLEQRGCGAGETVDGQPGPGRVLSPGEILTCCGISFDCGKMFYYWWLLRWTG